MNPSQSPELNIIEAVWDHLDREQKGSRHPKKSSTPTLKKTL